MKITVIAGDIANVRADALCTSTNTRLSLMMGTGAAIRERGGYEILRACEAIVAAEGGRVVPGHAYATTAGALPSKVAIHCVASDASHRSSDDIVRSCVASALALAAAAGCRSIAMPVFASGHARRTLDGSLSAMANAIAECDLATIDEIFIVVRDPDRLDEARTIVSRALPRAIVSIDRTLASDDEPASLWSTEVL
jgi:O-acetyl-ADP-ribose deacetylase (regulator of RNase III)